MSSPVVEYLNANPSVITSGNPLSYSWKVDGATLSDWIGLFVVGTPDTSFVWQYQTGGNPNGSATVAHMIQPAGQYEFRYFSGSGTGNKLATSNPVTINDTTSNPPPPTTPQIVLTPSTTSVEINGTMSVSWQVSGMQTNSSDWIALAPVGAPTTTYTWWDLTNGAITGSLPVLAPATVGQYEFRYFTSGSFTQIANSVPVTVTAPPPSPPQITLTASPGSVNPGDQLTVTWNVTGAAPTNADWIGLFLSSQPDSAWISYRYPGGVASGKYSFAAPLQTDQYNFRYFYNGSSTAQATSSNVSVNAVSPPPTPQVTLTASPSTVDPDGQLSLTWEVTSGATANDWVGLFPVGGSSSSPSRVIYTNGVATNTVPVMAPTNTGQYEFRYFLGGGNTAAATSNPITGAAPQVTLTASPDTAEPGDTLTVSWDAPSGRPSTDLIACYSASDPTRVVWSYAPNGLAVGSKTLGAPSSVGDYLFGYYLGDGAVEVAQSNIVTVSLPSSPVESGGSPPSGDSPPSGGSPPDSGVSIAENLPDQVSRAELEQIVINRAIADGEFWNLLVENTEAALEQLFDAPPPAGINFEVKVEAAGTFYHVVPYTVNEPLEDYDSPRHFSPPDFSPPDFSPPASPPDGDGDNASPPEETAATIAFEMVAPMSLAPLPNFKSQVNYLLYADPDFYTAFTTDPVAAIAQAFNFAFPDNINLVPLIESPTQAYIVLPYAANKTIFSAPYAVEFDGSNSSYVSAPVTESLNTQDAITVQAWIKLATVNDGSPPLSPPLGSPPESPPQRNSPPDFSPPNSPPVASPPVDQVVASTLTATGGWELRVEDNVPCFVVNINGTEHSTQLSPPEAFLHPDQWHYVAGVYDGAQLMLYLDGWLVSPPNPLTGQISAGAETLSIGTNFNGLINDVRVWSIALNTAQVRGYPSSVPSSIYSSLHLPGDPFESPPVSPPDSPPHSPPASPPDIVPQRWLDIPLCAWYAMTEGAGTTLFDHSGNGNDAEMNVALWVSTIIDVPK